MYQNDPRREGALSASSYGVGKYVSQEISTFTVDVSADKKAAGG